ncbi:MAG: hypothetical protein L0212_06190 [Acidobacteria bacterium]|nr:hypothetical protein [Acidobacteriota bacterium]
MKIRGEWLLAGWLAAGLLLPAGAPAQQQAPAANQARRLVVTFDGNLEDLPAVEPAEFQIELEKRKVAPKKIYNPQELPTVIAVVLTENIRQDFGTQLPALRDFITSQPPNTYVGVFYLTSQSIDNPTKGFQADLKKVAETLRAPTGQGELAPPSPYELIARIGEFMNRMPPARKEILFFSEGTDAMYPDASPGQNRNIRVALDRTRDFGIPVWVVFTNAIPPVTRRQAEAGAYGGSEQGQPGPTSASSGQDPRAMNDASYGGRGSDVMPSRPGGTIDTTESSARPRVEFNRANLKELADKSGGKMLSSKESLTDIAPLLAEFRKLLAQQLVLEFEGESSIRKVKMNRKFRDVKFLAPEK